MTVADMPALYATCAPAVAPSTIAAVMQAESGFNPWAIHVNGGARLTRQPADRAEAEAWATYLIERGFNADFGWMQVNSANLARLGLTVSTVFDPCLNIAAGAAILTDAYLQAARRFGADQPAALLAALSIYNTGSPARGVANGYVRRVQAAGAHPILVPPIELAEASVRAFEAPGLRAPAPGLGRARALAPSDPRAADTAVTGDWWSTPPASTATPHDPAITNLTEKP
jgi:type IV secretion system protein VirB1